MVSVYMTHYKAVLFDLDGTLIDSISVMIKETKKFSKESKINIPIDKMRELFLFSWNLNKKKRFLDKVQMAYKVGRELGLGRKDTVMFIKKAFSRYGEFRNKQHMVPGTVKTIKKLILQKVKVGVISSTHRRDVKNSLGDFRELFDVIICKEDQKQLKPSPEGILKACAKLKIKPAEAVYIGDLDDDIRAAKKAGAKSVFFTRTSKLLDIPIRVKADYKIDKMEQLIKIVK
jgi:phosphatidylglycerol:prolipoprotein diacylglycerol transferase